MKFIVYNDIHKFGPHALDVTYVYGENIIYNGDIVDLGSCKYSLLPEANAFLYDLIEKAQGNFTSGNHEKMMEHQYVIKDQVLFTHGDLIFKDITDARNFRWGREGSGWFRRMYVHAGAYLRNFLKKNQEISLREMGEAVIWAKRHKCHTVICGHKHPKKILTRSLDNVKLIVLPRGKHTVEV